MYRRAMQGFAMKTMIENLLPEEIEKRSFEIIEKELRERGVYDPQSPYNPILKRVIHTSADFEYVDNLSISPTALERAFAALKGGAVIVTDTNMAKSGINKAALNRLGCEVHCYMADEDVAKEAKLRGVTRALVSMEKAAKLNKKLIFAIGNAPTALIRLYELIEEGVLSPELIIGVPVGFVNVVESKELIIKTNIPYIVAKGRKGGSNVAACICNALLYMLDDNKM
ncbi:precorrin-8X methylmutase [Anaerocolumna cellulosilytica]|uniref:Precorrin-8X methylmutase n=2 Tax=Anaerocolumna cellulosilytica TaxID=433286 RepID=A0A6S6RBI3_9FIRM|nr:precorrin-8X methylmutase [Anaerocolumna cellulosilytica]